MCRFLMIKSQIPIRPGDILLKFSKMAQKSKALDGDWQGDGWGVCWLSDDKAWKLKKSIRPIWEDQKFFQVLPESRLICAHARSASFPHHKGNVDYNQPFICDSYAFVFNGLLKRVSFPVPVAGEIGSQKIWNILLELLKNFSPHKSLVMLNALLEQKSHSIQALNIGLCDRTNLFAFCRYRSNLDYYQLQFYASPTLKILSSAPLEGFNFQPVMPGEVLIF